MDGERRMTTLRAAGLVVEGQYPDVTSITVSERGQFHKVDVRPLVARRGDFTVFRTSEIQKPNPGTEQILFEN